MRGRRLIQSGREPIAGKCFSADLVFTTTMRSPRCLCHLLVDFPVTLVATPFGMTPVMKLPFKPREMDPVVDTEEAQAYFRVAFVLVIIAFYAAATWLFGQAQLVPALQGLMLYLTFACLWLWLVARSIGSAMWRQHMAVVLDHATFTAGVAWAGLALAPLMWASVFISVGHGLRFGTQRALFSATLGTVFLWVALYASPDWRALPMVMLGLVIAAFVVPLYVVSLSRRIEMLRRTSEAKAQALEEAANTDALTMLLNRRGFDRAASALADGLGRAKEPVAVILLDLDSFKAVNDTLGHAAGDLVLQQVAFHLRRSVRTSDTVARLGGDEFAVLLRSPGNREALFQIGQKVLAELANVHPPHHPELHVGASIGICMTPQGGSIDTAVLTADSLMYDAKRAGKGRLSLEILR